MSNLEAIIDDQKSESVIKTLASVASVSSRVIAGKLEQEQKRTRTETLATRAIKDSLCVTRLPHFIVKGIRTAETFSYCRTICINGSIQIEVVFSATELNFHRSLSNGASISLACVQTSPISFVATKEIGDVCTQATTSHTSPWSQPFPE